MRSYFLLGILLILIQSCEKVTTNSGELSVLYKETLNSELTFVQDSFSGPQYSEDAVLCNKGDSLLFILSEDVDRELYYKKISKFNLESRELDAFGSIRMFGASSIAWTLDDEVIIPSFRQYVGLFMVSSNQARFAKIDSSFNLKFYSDTSSLTVLSAFTDKEGTVFFVVLNNKSEKSLLQFKENKLFKLYSFESDQFPFKIFVDENYEIIVCDPINHKIVFINEEKNEEVLLDNYEPFAIQKDKFGNYFVLESRDNSILVLNEKKKLIYVNSNKSEKPSGLNLPTDFVLVNDELIVIDKGDNSLKSFQIYYPK